ncbi:AAA family ATPase, partial [Vibrio parahaemolyticus]
MIAGLFLRNYKCYSNINFIPFNYEMHEKLSIFIGENGIGKSSILESLDCLLNEVDPKFWDTTLGQRKDRTYICPVFLIKKTDFITSPEEEKISDAFWNLDPKKISNPDYFTAFAEWRDELEKNINRDEYLLFCIGKDRTGNVVLTSTIHKHILNQTRRYGVSKERVTKLFEKILSHYTYVYIPIESSISDILNLQAREMQALMDKSVTNEIVSLLSRKLYDSNSNTRNNRKSSIVDLINSNLDEYINGINTNLLDGYKFEPKGTNKKTVKPNDILSSILKEYFSIRPLTKDGKHINSLSSGQQRLALMDVAMTLLSTNQMNKQVILAIDEPENSLDSAHRFSQFSRLTELSEQY